MNYQGRSYHLRVLSELFVLGVVKECPLFLLRGRCWACCRDWRCLCGSASEPRYTPLVPRWPGPCRWPLRAATSPSDRAWTGQPAPSRRRQAPSSQRCTTTLITSERWRLWGHDITVTIIIIIAIIISTVIEARLGFLFTLSMFMDMPELIAILLRSKKDKVRVIWGKTRLKESIFNLLRPQ